MDIPQAKEFFSSGCSTLVAKIGIMTTWGDPIPPFSNQIYLLTLRPTQLTQASFLQKNQILQNVFLISVTQRWHSGVKNHEIWIFKVNFLCQKMSKSF